MYEMKRSIRQSIDVGTVLDTIKEPATLVAPDYHIIDANSRYREQYQLSGSAEGDYCYRASHGYEVPCDQAGENCPLRSCLVSGQVQRQLHVHITQCGAEHVDIEFFPILDKAGVVVCCLEIMHQVREAKALDTGDSSMLGRSPAFNKMLSLLHRVAPSNITALLLGETGTGKELAARAIHQASLRANEPFVTVECSGLSESLFESELFGHEKGAFTGATGRKLGLVESAQNGTLFLDEIGDIPLNLQVKLLRLIETGTFRRVGSVEVKHADIRLVCATHHDLRKLVDNGLFRRDLYYRIAPFPIQLPRLAERLEDLQLLTRNLLNRIEGGEGLRLTSRAWRLLSNYSFPGNIRELRNILERAVLLTDSDVIDVTELPEEVVEATYNCDQDDEFSGVCENSCGELELIPLHDLEHRYLRRVTAQYDGDNRLLAQALGISERTLYRKLQQLKHA